VLILIKHLRTPGHLQSLLQIILRWYTLLAGTSYAPLEYPYTDLPHLDSSAWLNSTRTFLSHSRSQLLIPSLPLPPVPFREHDRILMDEFLKLHYMPSQVKQVNYCRLFLRATRFSELTTLEGTSIDQSAWTGADRLDSPHDWPRQVPKRGDSGDGPSP
jgi:hypothetical protein